MSDVLSGDVPKSPKKARAYDLSFHRMNAQASLVPSPHLQHYRIGDRRTAAGGGEFGFLFGLSSSSSS